MAKRKKTKDAKAPPKTTVVSFRVQDSTVAKLDAYLEKLRAESPGGNWTRSSAALNLVIQKLEELDA